MLRAGQKLKEERLKKKLSLDDVEKGTKIKKNFLTAIEKSEYNKLPSSSYAHGFVRNYAEFLGLPVQEILALFRREFDERRVYKVLPESMVRGPEVPKRKFRINTKILLVLGVLMLLASFILYQFRYAFLNPPLYIENPAENARTTQDVTVSGTSDPNATVTVNNEPVTVDMGGAFTKRISLFPGKTTIIVKARSTFGKETVLQRNIEVRE
jgi:cytoskeletal protein RodZ